MSQWYVKDGKVHHLNENKAWLQHSYTAHRAHPYGCTIMTRECELIIISSVDVGEVVQSAKSRCKGKGLEFIE
jgi:hypothetical protein